ncbi:MAG: phasin family protein [Pseudomonadaceae bacterium]|nr:phasin family protein [Pseudomonadaceae bacterium]
MFQNMQDMFNPQATMQMMQSFWSQQQWSQNAEVYQKLATLYTQACSDCYQQQMDMAKQMMESSAACMQDMSKAQGLEELMSKQASWSKKASENASSNAQQLAKTLQQCQVKATEIIGKVVAENLKTSSTSTK